jgi:hypothetical protein
MKSKYIKRRTYPVQEIQAGVYVPQKRSRKGERKENQWEKRKRHLQPQGTCSPLKKKNQLVCILSHSALCNVRQNQSMLEEGVYFGYVQYAH